MVYEVIQMYRHGLDINKLALGVLWEKMGNMTQLGDVGRGFEYAVEEGSATLSFSQVFLFVSHTRY